MDSERLINEAKNNLVRLNFDLNESKKLTEKLYMTLQQKQLSIINKNKNI